MGLAVCLAQVGGIPVVQPQDFEPLHAVPLKLSPSDYQPQNILPQYFGPQWPPTQKCSAPEILPQIATMTSSINFDLSGLIDQADWS
jgi:hypothetical protein